MEIDKNLVGLHLIEILKRESNIKLIFKNLYTKAEFELFFKGLIFETSFSVLDKKVERIELTQSLGFKAITQLRYLGYNPSGYKQLLIQMAGSTTEYKIELICVFEHYELSPH